MKVGIYLSHRQRNSHIDNFWTSFSSRSSLDPLLITIYLSPSALFSRFSIYKRPFVSSYAISSVFITWKKKRNFTQRNLRSRQLCRLSFSFAVEAKRISKCRSFVKTYYSTACDSALSKHVTAYSAHPQNPHPQLLEKFSTAVHFSMKFPFGFHLSPAPTFTMKLLVMIIIN